MSDKTQKRYYPCDHCEHNPLNTGGQPCPPCDVSDDHADEGRVERVAKWMRHDAFDFPGPERDFDQEWNELDEGEREAWKRDARAVLAAADGEPRGEEP